MNFKKNSELIFGIIVLAFGLVYFLLTRQIPRKGVIDATFIPNILSVSMFILGILQMGVGYKKIKNFKDEKMEGVVEDTGKIDYVTVLKTVTSIVLYIAFLGRVGFLITTALYLFAQFIVLTPLDKKKNYVSYAVIATVTSVVIYFIFRNGLDLMLPEGIL